MNDDDKAKFVEYVHTTVHRTFQLIFNFLNLNTASSCFIFSLRPLFIFSLAERERERVGKRERTKRKRHNKFPMLQPTTSNVPTVCICSSHNALFPHRSNIDMLVSNTKAECCTRTRPNTVYWPCCTRLDMQWLFVCVYVKS